MANKFLRYLTGDNNFGANLTNGLLKPKGTQANWQHATRLFVDDTFRLSPRHKFLFYALFEIDPTSHRATLFTQRHSQTVGLLVKSADLPKFNFDSVTKNQYNRKKLIYKQINYEPVNINLHDDSAGIINALWAIYYGTYVTDRSLPNSAWNHLAYRNAGTSFDNFRYGLDSDKTTDMFKSISLYTMSRSRFNGYTLINPRIKSWSHGGVSYAEGDTVESSMSVEYEAVQYSSGEVSVNRPKGFATLHYDTAPSPLSVAGGGVPTITGEGGILSGLEQVFGDVSSGSAFSTPGGFLNTAIKAVNTYNNIKEFKDKGSFKGEIQNILNNPASIRGIANTVSGVAGAIFPKNTSPANSVIAAAKKLLP